MNQDAEELRRQGQAALSRIKETQSVGDTQRRLDDKEEEEELTAEQAEKRRAKRKARLTQVLSRGILNEKLRTIYDASVPEGRVGKFILDNEEEVIRYGNLGYTFEYTPDAKGLHESADNKVRVGDVVLMTISQEDREILREIRQDRIKKNLGLGRAEYVNKAQEHAEEGGPTPFMEGSIEIKKGG